MNCDVAISYPPCLHGHAIEPNLCECNEGWTDRICDQAVCVNECGENGHCMMPEVCECNPGWYSSDITSKCDSLNPIVLDPNCVESDTEKCLDCDYEYYKDPVTNLCHLCS